MRLVAYESGQILFQIRVDEIHPISGIYLPSLIGEVAKRYGLTLSSVDLADAIKNGAKFHTGKLGRETFLIAIKQLDLYNDGVLITTSNTDETELVFADLYDWLRNDHGYRDPVSGVRKKYFSSVVVDFDKPLEPLIKLFAEISKDYAKMLKNDNNIDALPQLFRIALSADPRILPIYTQTQFLIERRNDSDWKTNRYIATAPLSTHSLVSLLERIEKRL